MQRSVRAASTAGLRQPIQRLSNRLHGAQREHFGFVEHKMLARLETTEPGKVDHYFDVWNKLLGYLGDDYSVQERFFRHY